MTTEDTLIDQLLDRWDEAHIGGCVPDAEAICRDYPRLLPVLLQKVAALEQMKHLLNHHQDGIAEPFGIPDSELRPDESNELPSDAGTVVAASVRYRIISIHARGGLGEVLLAQDELLSRRVALKRMKAAQSDDPARRRRFLREAEITGRLDHPGIVSILSVGQVASGNPCYAMKFVSGNTLAEQTRKLHQQFAEHREPRQADFQSIVIRPLLSRFISVCNTVAYAHSQGIIHRDLKPANILLGEFGATYVVDWGLARSLNAKPAPARGLTIQFSEASVPHAETLSPADSWTAEEDACAEPDRLTRTGAVIGTPAFMSPEQADGENDFVGTASDIYSLGATLYFALTSQAPLVSHRGLAWIDQLKSGQFRRPREVQRLIPPALEAVCCKAMALKPSERYQSPLEFAADLDHWLADEPVSALPESLSERLARVSRRHRAWTQSLAAAAAIVAITAVVFVFLLNAQKNIAVLAELRATDLARQKTQLAQEKTDLAEQEAAARRIADEQNQLSLSTLKSVVFSISRKLKTVAGASEVRQTLLKTSIDGLNRVARTLETRTEADRNLMIAHNDIGKTYLLAGDTDGTSATVEAMKHYLRANDIGRKLSAENPNDPRLQRDLSVSYENIGDLQLQQRQLPQAEESYLQSLKISEQQIAASSNDPDLRRDVAFGYEKLGDVRMAREQLSLAREAFDRSHQLYADNVKAMPDNAMIQRDLLVLRSRLGGVYLQEGNLEQAAATYRQCLETCSSLEQIPDSGAQPRDRSVILNKLGSALQKQSLLTEATAAFEEGLRIAQQILQSAPDDASAQRDMSISLNFLGDVQMLAGQLDTSRENYLAGIQIRRALQSRDENSVMAKTDVAQSLLRLGELEVKAIQPTKAREYFQEASRLLRPLQDAGLLQSAADLSLIETIEENLSDLSSMKPD